MIPAAPEFSHVVRLDQATRATAGETIAANADERAALAGRFGLLSLDVLEADYALKPETDVLFARGWLRASLAQACVATGEPVPEVVDAPFAIRFLPELANAGEEEVEMDDGDCDTIFYAGESIDIGEAVAETLALLLDPYPRAPDADTRLRKLGVLNEEQASPFAALLALKGKSASGRD